MAPICWLLPEAAFEMGREREKERLKEGRQERERQTERMIYFMDLTPLRFSGILIIKV